MTEQSEVRNIWIKCWSDRNNYVHKVRAQDVSFICFIPESEVIFNVTNLVHLIAQGWSISITSCHCLFVFGPEESEQCVSTSFCIPVITHFHFL